MIMPLDATHGSISSRDFPKSGKCVSVICSSEDVWGFTVLHCLAFALQFDKSGRPQDQDSRRLQSQQEGSPWILLVFALPIYLFGLARPDTCPRDRVSNFPSQVRAVLVYMALSSAGQRMMVVLTLFCYQLAVATL